jgi:hypothetical protein
VQAGLKAPAVRERASRPDEREAYLIHYAVDCARLSDSVGRDRA